MKFRYKVETALFRVTLLLFRLLPRNAALAIGRLFGRGAFVVDSRHRKIALGNYTAAFPDSPEKEARRIIQKCYEFFGQYLADLLTFFPKFDSRRMNQFELQGLEHIQAAYASGQGAIFFTGHWGVWELMAMAQGANGYPLGLIARKLDNPYLEALLDTLRRSTGNWVIEKQEGFRPMLKAMKEGKAIAILIDQNVTTEERVFVDFFGQPASTTPALALLQMKTKASMVPAFALPLAGNRYRFTYGPPVEVELTGDRKADVIRITQACTAVIEGQIRKHPEYWLWMHRRWKTRPDPAEAAKINTDQVSQKEVQ